MKRIKILTITLAIVLITLISFCGVYEQYQNRMENKVKEYLYAMDLEGARNVRLKVNTEKETIIKDSDGNTVEDEEDLTDEQIAEKGYTKEEIWTNSEDIKNEENYNKSKEVIEKRLKELRVQNYIIKLDEQTGDILIELTENDKTDSIISNISTTGKFEIIDTDTNEVLMNNEDIKTVNVLYGSNSSTTYQGTTVYLSIEFTKEGSKKLEEISSKYVATEESTENTAETDDENEDANKIAEDNNEEKTTTTEKTITMKIDDEEIMTTGFDETLKTGKLQLSIGSATTDTDTLQGYIDRASSMATVLKVGKIPVVYDLEENQYILSDITNNELKIVKYAIIGVALIALIVLIIRYKILGVIGTISYIGLASLIMLVIRYANVVLSIEGIFGIAIVLILNYIFINKLLFKLKNSDEEITVQNIKKTTKETYKDFFIRITPVIIMTITFCFIEWIPISSFGMVMFWGILLIAIYNVVITNNLLEIKVDEKIGGNEK